MRISKCRSRRRSCGDCAGDSVCPLAICHLGRRGQCTGLARLTQADDAYRWICGGVQVNYHTLSDFRSQQGDFLDECLSANLAALMDAGVVKLKAVAEDGCGSGPMREPPPSGVRRGWRTTWSTPGNGLPN